MLNLLYKNIDLWIPGKKFIVAKRIDVLIGEMTLLYKNTWKTSIKFPTNTDLQMLTISKGHHGSSDLYFKEK